MAFEINLFCVTRLNDHLYVKAGDAAFVEVIYQDVMGTRRQRGGCLRKYSEVGDLVFVPRLPGVGIQLEDCPDLGFQVERKGVAVRAKVAFVSGHIYEIMRPGAVGFREHMRLKRDANDEIGAGEPVSRKPMGKRCQMS